MWGLQCLKCFLGSSCDFLWTLEAYWENCRVILVGFSSLFVGMWHHGFRQKGQQNFKKTKANKNKKLGSEEQVFPNFVHLGGEKNIWVESLEQKKSLRWRALGRKENALKGRGSGVLRIEHTSTPNVSSPFLVVILYRYSMVRGETGQSIYTKVLATGLDYPEAKGVIGP